MRILIQNFSLFSGLSLDQRLNEGLGSALKNHGFERSASDYRWTVVWQSSSLESMDFLQVGSKIATLYIPFLFALCFHEYAHGWVARHKGDRTAESMGRLSMNPIVHMDMIGTVLLPLAAIIIPGFGIFFGWAKPVPVDSRNLRHPTNDMFWIALAGPLSNILLAIVGTVAMVLSFTVFVEILPVKAIRSILQPFILINLFLAFFNLIPVHPLDGGKVLARFLPYEMNRKLEENQQMLSMALLVLILVGGFRYLAIPVFWIFDNLMRIAERLII